MPSSMAQCNEPLSQVTKQANYDAQIRAIRSIIDYVDAHQGTLNAAVHRTDVHALEVQLPGRCHFWVTLSHPYIS